MTLGLVTRGKEEKSAEELRFLWPELSLSLCVRIIQTVGP